MTKLSCFILCNLLKPIHKNLSVSIIQSPPFYKQITSICMDDIILNKKEGEKEEKGLPSLLSVMSFVNAEDEQGLRYQLLWLDPEDILCLGETKVGRLAVGC